MADWKSPQREQRIAYIDARLMGIEQGFVRFQQTEFRESGSLEEASQRFRKGIARARPPDPPRAHIPSTKAIERFELANEGLDDILTIQAQYIDGDIDIDTMDERIGAVLASMDDPWYT